METPTTPTRQFDHLREQRAKIVVGLGQIRLQGEIWAARCEAGAVPGDRVRVTGRDGLTLIVEPAQGRK